MTDFPPRVFDFGKPAVCQQPFTHEAVRYKPGEPFPYEQLGLTKLQMRGFWLASLVDFKDTAASAPSPAKKQRASR